MKNSKKKNLCSNNEHAINKQYLDQILLYQLNILIENISEFYLPLFLLKQKY